MTPSTVRLTAAERAAVKEAMRKRRQRTGENVRLADAIRSGLATYCAAEGIEWPAE